MELTLLPSLQIKPRKYSAGNMCDIFFEKTKGRGGIVNRTSVYAEATVRRVP